MWDQEKCIRSLDRTAGKMGFPLNGKMRPLKSQLGECLCGKDRSTCSFTREPALKHLQRGWFPREQRQTMINLLYQRRNLIVQKGIVKKVKSCLLDKIVEKGKIGDWIGQLIEDKFPQRLFFSFHESPPPHQAPY